jgi:ribonuclease/clavin/mitogillin
MTGEASPERLSASVWRVELPSRTLPPFTTTNTYLIVDRGVAAIVDPGFEEGSLPSLARALTETGGRLVKAVLLTHTHGDHRAALPLVLTEFGAPAVYAHPLEHARLEGHAAVALVDERSLTVGGALVRALHTPGHSPGHLCFHLPEEGVLLAGDLAAGSGSVWVGLPEGDIADYLDSLDRVMALPGLRLLGPGHGSVVDGPYRLLAELRAHRLEREGQVLAALETPRSLGELRDDVYGELAERLRGPAEASLLAHLRKLMAEMRVVHLGDSERGPFVKRS